MKNLSYLLSVMSVLVLFVLLVVDYFGIYTTNNQFADDPNYAVFSPNNIPKITTVTLLEKDALELEEDDSDTLLAVKKSVAEKKAVEPKVAKISGKKYFILHQGGLGWRPMLAKNMIKNQKHIESLPFDGFTTLGNSYTDRVMKEGHKVSYKRVWSEVKGLKHLYKKKTQNFMIVNIHFPGDFWNDAAWEQVAQNFAVVARVAKNLGFKGIVFDDEPYSEDAKKMTNFRFPTKKEVKQNPTKYQAWEKKGAQSKWVDYSSKESSYRNRAYDFPEHMAKVTSRFERIMQLMVKEYPDISVLVYFGSMFSHPKTDWKDVLTSSTAGTRTHEYKGAMFTGFKKGLGARAELHDMAERYAYRKSEHFKNSYQWRKHDMAKDVNNDGVDGSWNWFVPKEERANWSQEIGVGFMSFDKGLKNPYSKEYDTRDKSSPKDIELATKKALEYSDKYVVYFCLKQNWLLPEDKRFPISSRWRKAIENVYEAY